MWNPLTYYNQMKKTTLIASFVFCSISIQNYSQSPEDIGNKDSLDAVQDSTQQKIPLTPEDYKLFGTDFFEIEISNNGDWYIYTLSDRHTYEYATSVGSTKTDIKYDFPFGSGGQFSDDSKWFGCLVKEKGLALLDLKKGTIQWLSNVSKFEFLEVSARDKYMIAYRSPTVSTESPSLLIMDLANGKQESIPGIIEYRIHRPSNNLAYIVDIEEKKSVAIRTLESVPITTLITINALHKYKKLVWSSQGNALTFYQEILEGSEKQKSYKLYYYNAEQGPSKLKYLDPTIHTELFQNMDLTDRRLRISDDGMAVFFEMIRKEHSERTLGKGKMPNDSVQVWNTKDKRIYPNQREYRQAEFGPSLTVWWPGKDSTLVLETKELPETVIARDGKYMLSYNPTAYAPHFKHTGDIDLYLTDLETSEHNLFLKRQEYGKFGFSYNVAFSPKGKYISYFRDKHWWIYDLEKKTHANVTKGLGLQLYETAQDGAHSGGMEPYGGAHRFINWMPGDKELIIYDRYDVWLISPTGKARRITQGREKQVRYRIDRNSHSGRVDIFPQVLLSNFEKEQFIMSQGLVFQTLGTTTKASGYAIWKPKIGIKELVYKDMHVSELIKAKYREAYIYLEESFDTPPRLRYWEKGMSDSKVLVESNPQQKQFQWGRAELIHYTGPEGEPLQGALYYPANYKAGKKYPIIVSIYEIQSQGLHRYVHPTEYLGDGFNRTNYTLDGYLVFLPDIKYKFNDPGISAVQCIEVGVQTVLAKGIVETDYIGLVGHSFGGYETAFIVTQTNMFATAVAGAAYTDLVSAYHSVAFGDGEESRISWFESQQWRFTDSFYQNQEAYLRNSPLHYAVNINTPLLLWTGGKDSRVDWHQSIELYSGLRRLGKECTLLLYPDEGHAMQSKPNQVNLTKRMKAWFDTYLKPDRTER
jgi:dipeptidyl aminopeptidase/acylaminoacyl peptidase